jgi:hypothetical protein
MSRASTRTIALAFASLLGAGCTATPIPEPPADALDFNLIHGPEVSPTTNMVQIIGEPGAGPGGQVLRVTNLDDVQAPIDVDIAADGSFSLQIAAGQNDELRFHTRDGRNRAAPVDIIWSRAELVTPERIACLVLVPLQQQDFGFVDVGAAPAVHTFSLQNDCQQTVQVTAARLRRTVSDYAVGAGAPPLPSDVAPGEGLSWDLELVPTDTGDTEEIFLLELSHDGSVVRYPITLFGDGR